MQLAAQLAQVQKGENRGGGAAFHVAGAAPVDAAVNQFAAPRVVCPAGAIARREAVDMSVEREMTPGCPSLERRHDVRHHLVGRDHPTLGAMPLQELTDVVRRLARVAGRIRALTANEAPEEIEQNLAVALNPLQQLRLAAFHYRFSHRVYPSGTRSSNLWAGCGADKHRQAAYASFSRRARPPPEPRSRPAHKPVPPRCRGWCNPAVGSSQRC
jgi:hypothetical protein